MQGHERFSDSKTRGGPQPAGNESTRVITCAQHGTMRTGGTCGQCQPAGSARARVLGRETAGQHLITEPGADMHAGLAAHLPSEARTPEGQAFAREYDWAAETLVRELKELDEPGLTPGAPHPDPYLAAKGWHVCGHGIYTRTPTATSKPNRRRAEMNRIARLQHRLSDRMHARGDAFADQAGWATTTTIGRFGFGARVYRDPRFAQRQAEARRPAQATGASR